MMIPVMIPGWQFFYFFMCAYRILVRPLSKYRKKPLYPVGSYIHFMDCSVKVVKVEKQPGKPWVYYLEDDPGKPETEDDLRDTMHIDMLCS